MNVSPTIGAYKVAVFMLQMNRHRELLTLLVNVLAFWGPCRMRLGTGRHHCFHYCTEAPHAATILVGFMLLFQPLKCSGQTPAATPLLSCSPGPTASLIAVGTLVVSPAIWFQMQKRTCSGDTTPSYDEHCATAPFFVLHGYLPSHKHLCYCFHCAYW
jgi:hypothetical protein